MSRAIYTIATLLVLATLCGCSPNNNTPVTNPAPVAPTPPATTVTPPAKPQIDPQAEADKAWQNAEKLSSETSYSGFATSFPQDSRAAKAIVSAGRMAWGHAQRAGTANAYREFASNYPNDSHVAQAIKLAEGEEVSLTDAIKHGWVRTHITGSGLESVSLTVKRLVHRPLKLTLPAGALFVCGGGAQNMVACSDESIDLTSSDSEEVSVAAACANFYRDQPDGSDKFTVTTAHSNPQLRKLMAVIAKGHYRAIVRQLAIWSITDDPTRSEAESHTMPGPDPADFKEAAALLREAGIKPSSRQMFQN